MHQRARRERRFNSCAGSGVADSPAEAREALDGFREGKVDILVGTHRLLSRDVRPRDLGLTDVADYVAFGASPRGPISLVAAGRALALIRGRDYVVPADLEALVRDAFRHRLVLSYRALAEEVAPDTILDQVLAKVPLPQIDLGRYNAA